MFFSSELLSKRDSGFGLLWLAATLGSKFKKLPKRSVLTADISRLCNLIAQPAEPLALRLSSCLMVGAARVYKVKQEMFLADVSTCVASLKKVVQEMQAIGAHTDLQMAQPTARPSALTLPIDPTAGGAFIDFDAFIADWDDYLNPDHSVNADELEPGGAHAKINKRKKTSLPSEELRAENCTLKEHHDHLFSASFDITFSGGHEPSSSQNDLVLDDALFATGDLDLAGGLGEELAKELGEGWGGSPAKSERAAVSFNDAIDSGGPPVDFAFDLEPQYSLAPFEEIEPSNGHDDVATTEVSDNQRKRKAPSKENILPPGLSSPARSFSRQFLSQDRGPAPLRDVTPVNQAQAIKKIKKTKRTRLLLDARTELTDEELKLARAEYNRRQEALRSELKQKRLEKDTEKFIEDIIWGVPKNIHAPDLVDFWQENFKVQVEARTGVLHIHVPDEPARKRRKTELVDDHRSDPVPAGMDLDLPDIAMFEPAEMELDPANFRSSEEPGQGRQNSRPPSSIGKANFGLDFGSQDVAVVSSQRSSLFPWDNAGAGSSSSGPFGFIGSDQVRPDRADSGVRGNSLSGPASPISGRVGGGTGLSPANFDRDSQLLGEDYQFNVPLNETTQSETQQSDANLITLERNSFNFLEYTKMQQNTLTDISEGLSFETIVPTATSTRHVAAAAFYHCLVLATKDMLQLKQSTAYGPISILVMP